MITPERAVPMFRTNVVSTLSQARRGLIHDTYRRVSDQRLEGFQGLETGKPERRQAARHNYFQMAGVHDQGAGKTWAMGSIPKTGLVYAFGAFVRPVQARVARSRCRWPCLERAPPFRRLQGPCSSATLFPSARLRGKAGRHQAPRCGLFTTGRTSACTPECSNRCANRLHT